MKLYKRVISFIVTLAIVAGIIPLSTIAASAETTYSGQCGEDVYWRFDTTTETLTISGTGPMYDDYSFWECFFEEWYWVANGNPAVQIVIESGVTTIGKSAFSNCPFISINISNSITSIGDGAFAGGSLLRSITIPNSVTSIGYGAFSQHRSLESVALPTSITRIDECTFELCRNLRFVTIPNSVTEIDHGAFRGCDNLTSITIPKSVLSIGDRVFMDCERLTTLVVENDNPVYHSEGNCIIHTQSKTLIEGCNNSVIPSNNSVINIADNAFTGRSNLISITIPESVLRIGDHVFWYCDRLATLIVEENNPVYHSEGNCIIHTQSKTLVVGCRGSIIPSNGRVTSVGYSAFAGCETLRSIDIPNGITTIDNGAFNGCYNLDSVTMPNSLMNIGSHAFAMCNITSMTIPHSVNSIGEAAFWGCYNLTDITIYNSMTEIGNEAIEKGTTICGYVGSTAEEYALANGNTFYNIDTHVEYYAEVGKAAVVTRNKNGTTLSGCTITVGNRQYVADGHTTFINIPEEYTGDITVSKDGYITSALPVEMLKKYNFFVMYSDAETTPITQHYLLRDANSSGNGYVDLLRSSEYIYDLGNKKHDIYIDVNPNGHTVKSIYLLQGTQKVMLKNGMNYDINSNGLFNSDGGTIYLCIETSDGTIYKTNSKIVAAKTRVTLDADIQGAVSGVVDEELSAVGGWSYTGKFKLGDLPVSITIEENKVKGTIGIKGSEQSTATWYEAISGTIKKHEDLYGDEEYDSETIEELEKNLKDSGGDIVEGYSSFGIDVSGSIIGYIEANWNPVTCKLEDIQIGMILKIAGEASYTQQSSFLVVSVPIPYYWTVEFGIELAAKIGGNWEYGANDKVDFSVEMPELSVGAELTGSLCLGLDKIIGGGGKVKGGLTVTFNAPDYSFTTSVWELSYEIALTGQLAGFSGDLNLKDGTYQIYPKDETKTATFVNEALMSSYAQNNKLMASAYSLKYSTYNSNAAEDESPVYTFKSNGYTYSSPSVAVLSDGTAVMVWVDYDSERTNINKTALFYSVYNPKQKVWSDPQQVENDGTPDDFPVLKAFDNKIHLVWNDADKALADDATFLDMLSGMGISYAVFNGSAFTSVSSVSGQNDYMDVCADIAIVNNTPAVVWIKNQENDIFGQNGLNSIMVAKYTNNTWDKRNAVDTYSPINSVTIVDENGIEAIYYSTDVDDATDTFDDYEIFTLYNDEQIQISNNEHTDTALLSSGEIAYWVGNGQIASSYGEVIDCKGIGNEYIVVEDAFGYRAIIYTVSDADGNTEYMLCKETDTGFSYPVLLTSGNHISGGISAYYNDDTLLLITNEIDADTLASSIKVYEFNNQPDLLIEKVYYDQYTLMEGGELRTTITLKNNGCESVDGYILYAYADEELLLKKEMQNILLPGQETDDKIQIDLPSNIDFNQIKFSVEFLYQGVSLVSEPYLLSLSLQDISLENAIIVSDNDTANLSVSVVNRGISELSDITVYLHKGSENGEVIGSYNIFKISSREEVVVQFDVSNYVTDETRFYVTTDALENERNIANNSDFALLAKFAENEVIKESIYDLYDKLLLDNSQTVTVNNDNIEAIYIFVPEKDGLYSFYSYDSNIDTYGYIYDSNMNELASDDDGGDGSNFNVQYALVAGEIYYLKSRPYSDSSTGSYRVEITRVLSISKLEIITLPDRMDYYACFEDFWYDGLKIKATFEDGSTVDWNYGSSEFLAGYDVEISNDYIDNTYLETIISCGGKTAAFKFNVKENPVDHLELVSGTSRDYIENYNGYTDSDGNFIYYTNYPNDAVIKIVYTDGTSVTAKVGDYVEDYYVSWNDDQNKNLWFIGTDNTSTISYLDHTVNLPITVVKNKVANIEIVSGKVTCIENTYGYETGDGYYYYYDVPSDVSVKINYTDGTSKTVNVNDMVDGYGFSWDDDQSETPWTLGDDNYLTLSYLGITTHLPVSVITNPVDRIVINSAPTREYVYGDTEYGYLYSDGDYEFYPTDMTGLSFTVYYTDGTSKTFTCDDIDEDDNINGYGYNLYYDEYNPEIGNFPVTFEYVGKSADYTVVLKESTVTSIAVTKKPNKTEYTYDYSPDFIGMEVTITYTDGTTKVVTLTNENLVYEYTPWWGELCYKVEVDGHTLRIEPYYGEDMYYVAYYLGSRCEIKDITFVESKEVKSIDLDNVSWNGDGMTVKIIYTDETTETITLDIADFFDFEDSSVAGYGKTENGLLYYYIETYSDEDGNVEEYMVSILDKDITVEAETVMLGDVTGDGIVNNKDVTMLRRYLVGGWDVTIDIAAADVNADGSVNNKDMTLLRRYLVGGWDVALG